MLKQSYKKRFLLIVIVMISVFSFSAMSIPASAEKDNMVSDGFDKTSEEKNTDTSSSDKTTKEDTSETDDQQTGSTLSSGMSVWSYFKVVLALLFVVALLFFVLKLVNRNNKKYQSNQMLQNLGGISVGQQKSVQLLKVGNSLFLIGVGEDIHIIKEITDETEQQTLLKMYDDKQEMAVQVPYIAEMFNGIKNKVMKNPTVQPKENAFKNELDEKLNQIKKNRQKQLDELNQKENDNG